MHLTLGCCWTFSLSRLLLRCARLYRTTEPKTLAIHYYYCFAMCHALDECQRANGGMSHLSNVKCINWMFCRLMSKVDTTNAQYGLWPMIGHLHHHLPRCSIAIQFNLCVYSAEKKMEIYRLHACNVHSIVECIARTNAPWFTRFCIHRHCIYVRGTLADCIINIEI